MKEKEAKNKIDDLDTKILPFWVGIDQFNEFSDEFNSNGKIPLLWDIAYKENNDDYRK